MTAESPKPRSPDDLPSERDSIFADPTLAPSSFRFDEAVAKVFPDMLRRSIPGYANLLHLISVHAARTLADGAVVYDLGCSLGAVGLAIRHALGPRDAQLILVDNSEAMVERCRELLQADAGLCPVSVELGDVSSFPLQPCDLCVMNFTLQFVPRSERPQVLASIFSALRPGGSLILSEKTHADVEGEEDFYRQTHDAFRQANGYSQMELSRKREALMEYLKPQTTKEHVQALEAAGFTVVEWFRCLQFVSWVAIKS